MQGYKKVHKRNRSEPFDFSDSTVPKYSSSQDRIDYHIPNPEQINFDYDFMGLRWWPHWSICNLYSSHRVIDIEYTFFFGVIDHPPTADSESHSDSESNRRPTASWKTSTWTHFGTERKIWSGHTWFLWGLVCAASNGWWFEVRNMIVRAEARYTVLLNMASPPFLWFRACFML